MYRLLQVAALVLALVPSVLFAQKSHTRERLAISAGLGTGTIGASCDFCGDTDRESGTTGYLRIGGYAGPKLLIGGEANGFKNTVDGIDQTSAYYMAVAQWYPNAATGWFLKGGLGLATYRISDEPDEITSNALGMTLGMGYDIRLASAISLTPYLDYLVSTKGELKLNDISSGLNLSTNVFHLGLGLTWH